MKKRNVALSLILTLSSAVLAASVILLVLPQIHSDTATDVSKHLRTIQEEIDQKVDSYTDPNAIVEKNLEQTQKITEEAQAIAGLNQKQQTHV